MKKKILIVSGLLLFLLLLRIIQNQNILSDNQSAIADSQKKVIAGLSALPNNFAKELLGVSEEVKTEQQNEVQREEANKVAEETTLEVV